MAWAFGAQASPTAKAVLDSEAKARTWVQPYRTSRVSRRRQDLNQAYRPET